jgi:hypothetical protein
MVVCVSLMKLLVYNVVNCEHTIMTTKTMGSALPRHVRLPITLERISPLALITFTFVASQELGTLDLSFLICSTRLGVKNTTSRLRCIEAILTLTQAWWRVLDLDAFSGSDYDAKHYIQNSHKDT